jgi:hypothetical protein
MLHQRQGHAAPLLGWIDRDQADMSNCAVVRTAGDSGRLTIECGEQPAIRLERQVELKPILAASAAIGGLLNRVGVIQIGGGEGADSNGHSTSLFHIDYAKTIIACGSAVLSFFW